MKFIDKKEKLEFLLEIIEKESTGNTKELCVRLCISKRTLHRYINDLRSMGYLISFCQQRKTYYLINEDKKKLQKS